MTNDPIKYGSRTTTVRSSRMHSQYYKYETLFKNRLGSNGGWGMGVDVTGDKVGSRRVFGSSDQMSSDRALDKTSVLENTKTK